MKLFVLVCSVLVWCSVAVKDAEPKNYELIVTLDTERKIHQPLNNLTALGFESFSKLSDERLCDPDVPQIAGYLLLKDEGKYYFFWAFYSRNSPETDPVSLWMTGGPGCSSGVALFAENGPCTVNDDLTTTKNEHSWNSHATMIYIDQPAGTGFSYGPDHDHYEEGISRDMDIFLSEFFTKYDMFQSNDFFIFGESYGGHYVPATANRVVVNNEKGRKPHINLQGIGVGNGLTDVVVQYQFYAKMAYNSTTAPARVSKSQYEKMVKQTPACIEEVKKCNVKGHPKQACVEALNFCNFVLVMPFQQSGYNLYDMRVKCEVPPLCYDFSNIEKYLNSKDVQAYLGVDRKWESCNTRVNQEMSGDFMLNYQDQIPLLLERNITVLIYAGDVDYICNWLGNRAWTKRLEWPGKEAFNAAGEKDWVVNGKVAGKSRSANGFTFLQVYQAGHMVPLDQPVAALSLFETAINRKSFP